MGCCASVKVSPGEISTATRGKNNEFIEQAFERTETREKSKQNFGQNDDNRIGKETQQDDEKTARDNEAIPHNSSNILSSDLAKKTDGDDLQRDIERTGDVEYDKNLEKNVNHSQTSNQSSERSETREKLSEQDFGHNDNIRNRQESQLDDEETARKKESFMHNSSNLVVKTEIEISGENLLSNFDDSKQSSKNEEVLSETAEVKKGSDKQTRNETRLDKEELLADNDVILKDLSYGTLDLVSKTEDDTGTEIERNVQHDEGDNNSTEKFARSDQNSPDILENEPEQEQKDLPNTDDNFREINKDEEVSTEISLEKKEDFTAIDQHALSAPEKVKKSISTLADYLLKPANSDSKKARVIFMWIVNNIRYNAKGLFSGQYGETDAESVLRSGTSVCSGYANLFEALCKIAGLPVKVISGFSKGFGYSPENPFTPMTKTDHAWNVVRIDGDWRFIECTWGAGVLDKNNSFQKKLEPFYFFTDPKHFINAHFPWKSDEEEFANLWQLLDNPISLETYNKAVKLDRSALMWNIFPLTHKESIVEAHEEIDIEIEDKEEVLCGTTSKLYDMKSGFPCNEFIFLRQERSRVFSISIRPPSNGKYELTIYGKIDKSETTHQSLMTYVIKFSNVCKKFGPFPQNNGQMWGMDLEAFDNGFVLTEKNRVPIQIDSGEGFVERTFATTRKVPTIAKIVPATKKLSLSERKYCMVTTTDTNLNIKACFPDVDFYKLDIMCQRVEGNDSYYSMACFLINCTNPANPCLGYPKAYPQATEFSCKLLEPLSAQLPANTTVTCRFQSPLVVKAMVPDMKMTREGDEWSCTVTTPSSGTEFYISGNIDDGNSYYRLFQFDIN